MIQDMGDQTINQTIILHENVEKRESERELWGEDYSVDYNAVHVSCTGRLWLW